MKAWLVREKGEFCAAVVFAETRGKAKVRAKATDCCEDVAFCDIEVYRMPQADKYYRDGKTEMDWFDPEDRFALVSECGFTCEYVEPDVCKVCNARYVCDRYSDTEK